MVCAQWLVGAGCEQPKIDIDGVQLVGELVSAGPRRNYVQQWTNRADDNDDDPFHIFQSANAIKLKF